VPKLKNPTFNLSEKGGAYKRSPSLGAFYSPDYCIENFNARGDNPAAVNYYKSEADSLNEVISPGWGFTAGVDALFPFKGERFSLKTGLYYAVKTIRYNGFVYDNGIYPGFEIYKLNSFRKEKMTVFEIPLALDCSTLKEKKERRFRLSSFAGILFSLNNAEYQTLTKRFWTNYNAPQSESSYLISTADAYSVFGIGGIAGISAKYMFKSQFAISLSPLLKYYPVEFYRNDPVPAFGNRVTKSSFSAGCAIELIYHFD
jgi:hypothetical protein